MQFLLFKHSYVCNMLFLFPKKACLGFVEGRPSKEARVKHSNHGQLCFCLGKKEFSMVGFTFVLQGHDESETPASPTHSPVEEDLPIFPVTTQETNSPGAPHGKRLTQLQCNFDLRPTVHGSGKAWDRLYQHKMGSIPNKTSFPFYVKQLNITEEVLCFSGT